MKNKKAVSLIELVLLTAILAISVSPLLLLFKRSFQGQELYSTVNIQAAFLAQGVMERLLSSPFYTTGTGNGGLRFPYDAGGDYYPIMGQSTWPFNGDCINFGPYDSGECDFHGWFADLPQTEFASGQWFYQYRARCIDPNAADLGAASAELLPIGTYSDYLKMTVWVWNINYPDRRVEINTIITPYNDL